MRLLAALALLATAAAAAPDADGYFEIGVDYLKKGHFKQARAAFSESLLQAPGQPVTMALCAVAGAAEGRPADECALLLRWAVERTPQDKRLRFRLQELLPTPRALALLEAEYARALKNAPKARRKGLLTVLAFLQTHDADPRKAPALDTLRKEAPKDKYALALKPKQPVRP